MRTPNQDTGEFENKSTGRPKIAGQTELPRDTDPIEAHVGTGHDGYDQGGMDYEYARIPAPKSTNYGEGPKVAQRERAHEDNNM